MAEKPTYHPEVREACEKYTKADQKAALLAEGGKWERAAAAFDLKAIAQKHGQSYLQAASDICKASQPLISMEVSAEEIRRRLNLDPKGMPKSLSAFYDLSRFESVSLKLAKEDKAARQKVEAEVKKLSSAIMRRELTHKEMQKKYQAASQKLRKQNGQPLTSPVERAELRLASAEEKQESVQALTDPKSATPVMVITIPKLTPRTLEEVLRRKDIREAFEKAMQTGEMLLRIKLQAPAAKSTPSEKGPKQEVKPLKKETA